MVVYIKYQTRITEPDIFLQDFQKTRWTSFNSVTATAIIVKNRWYEVFKLLLLTSFQIGEIENTKGI